MQFKMFGLSVDLGEGPEKLLSSKEKLIWSGPGEPPKCISKKGVLGETVFVRDEFLVYAKLPHPEDASQEKVITDYLKTGAAFVVGWTRPDSKDRRDVFVSLTELLLVPWLTELGKRVLENPKTALPMYKTQVLDYMSSPEVMQPDDLLKWVLHNGSINHVRTTQEATLGAAWLHYLLNGPFPSIQSVVSWSKQEFEEDEDGDIVLGAARTSAWLFTAPSSIGYRSAHGEASARARIAAGSVIPYDAQTVTIDAASPTKLWIDFQAYLAAGVPVFLEQKSRWLMVGGAIVNGKFVSILGAMKMNKFGARVTMNAAVNSTIDPKHHVLRDDKLRIMSWDGESFPIQSGIEVKVAIGNFRGYASSGAVPSRMMFHVRSERTLKSQVTVAQLKQLDLQGTIGKTILPWQSAVGVRKTLVNNTGHPVIVDKITSKPDVDEKFSLVTVSCHIPVTSSVAKLRGPAKIQTFNPDFLPEAYQWDWKPFGNDVMVIVDSEGNKNPGLTMRRAWALETNTECVMSESGDWDHEDAFRKWYEGKIKSAILWIPMDHATADIARQGGSTIKEKDGVEYLVDTFEWIETTLVFGIESMASSIRTTTTSPTSGMQMNFAMNNRCVHPFKASNTLKSLLYDNKWALTKAADLKPLLEKNWSEFLHLASKKWRNGSVIRVLTTSGPIEVFLDWKVLDLFTHGDVNPDDVFGALTYKFLANYVLSVDQFLSLPDEVKAGPFAPYQHTTPIDEQAHKNFIKTHNDVVHLASRLKGAMTALGFSTGMMRRMVAPARVVPMLVSIGINSIPRDEAWMSTNTMYALKMKQYINIRGTQTKVHRDHLVTRFPTANYGRVRIILNDKCQDGIIFVSTLTQQCDTKGDSDGDTYPIVPADEVATMIDQARKDRELVTRFLRMLGFNKTVSVQQPLTAQPEHVEDVWWPEEAKVAEKSGTTTKYTRFASLPNTPMTDWLKITKLWRPEDGSAIAFDLGQYSDWGEQVSRFNTAGIGYGFNVAHVCWVMKSVYYGWDWDKYQLWSYAEEAAQAVYEDVYLAGGPNAKQWTFHLLFEEPKIEDLDKWRDALITLGFDKAREKFAWTARDGKTGRTDMATVLMLARQMTVAYQSYWQNGYIRKEQKTAIGGYVKYVPLIGLLRALFGYELKTRWMSKMPTVEQVAECIRVIPDTSPIWMYHEFALTQLYPYVLEVARGAALQAYETQLGM